MRAGSIRFPSDAGRPLASRRGFVMPFTTVRARMSMGGTDMDRRDFIKSAGIAAARGALAGASLAPRPSHAQVSDSVPGPQPNILFILVDELRFPSVFPSSVTATNSAQAVDQFLAQYMPN